MPWCADRRRWESRDGRFYFDPEAADRAVSFFRTFLMHNKGRSAGTPFEPLDWQRDLLLRPLFGVRRARDGFRRFRKVFVAIPKKNGKSPLGSGLALLLTFADGEPGAEGYAAAADREQARIVHEDAKTMVESARDELGRNPFMEYGPRLEVFRNAIVSERLHASFKVCSADAKTKHGPRPHVIVFDELHAQPDRELYETLSRGVISRDQPVLLMFTTAGDDDESICFEEWEYARRVTSTGGAWDEVYLPVIFEASADADWQDPATWARVNPSLGVTITEEALQTECRAAQNEPRKRNDFLRYHLNRWTNQAVSWIPVEQWDACRDVVTEDELRGARLAGGLDMAQKTDLAAFVVAAALPLRAGEQPVEAEVIPSAGDSAPTAPERDDQAVAPPLRLSLNFRLALIPFFWLPEDTLRQRAHEDGVAYPEWRERGLLRATEGVMIDGDRIAHEIIHELAPRYGLKGREVGYDPAFATQIAIRLGEGGLTMVEVLQNYKHLSEAAQVFEALVKAGRVVHGGHRLLRWCVENVAVKQDDAGRIKPVKPKKSSTKRIDGVVASIMALSRLLVAPEPHQSVYELRAAAGEEDIVACV